jgi:hypothetical protein
VCFDVEEIAAHKDIDWKRRKLLIVLVLDLFKNKDKMTVKNL